MRFSVPRPFFCLPVRIWFCSCFFVWLGEEGEPAASETATRNKMLIEKLPAFWISSSSHPTLLTFVHLSFIPPLISDNNREKQTAWASQSVSQPGSRLPDRKTTLYHKSSPRIPAYYSSTTALAGAAPPPKVLQQFVLFYDSKFPLQDKCVSFCAPLSLYVAGTIINKNNNKIKRQANNIAEEAIRKLNWEI